MTLALKPDLTGTHCSSQQSKNWPEYRTAFNRYRRLAPVSLLLVAIVLALRITESPSEGTSLSFPEAHVQAVLAGGRLRLTLRPELSQPMPFTGGAAGFLIPPCLPLPQTPPIPGAPMSLPSGCFSGPGRLTSPGHLPGDSDALHTAREELGETLRPGRLGLETAGSGVRVFSEPD